MKSVCIFNNKGGVGKTTLLCNIASSLCYHHKKNVLIIDADPQCNATSYALDDIGLENIYEEKKAETIYSAVEPFKKGKGGDLPKLPIIESAGFGINILPGDPKLALAEDFLARDWLDACSGDERGLRTTFFFNDILEKCSDYDIVLIDVGPSLGALNRAILLMSDYFLVPVSSDIFSLQALSNIRLSLEEWQDDLRSGLNRHYKRNPDSDFIEWEVSEKTKFIGYVTQQYTSKSVEGVKVPVKAFEKIIKRLPSYIKRNLTDKFSKDKEFSSKIGEVPYLQSLIPLSQNAHKPIFRLGSSDGVVGAHFARVREFDEFIAKLTGKFIENLEAQE